MDQLTAYARHEFRLSAPGKDGHSRRDHLLSAQRQTGKSPVGLAGPKRPLGSEMLWFAFVTLSAQRAWSDFGAPVAIGYTEMAAWSSLNNYKISLNDLALLRLLDREYRVAHVQGRVTGDDDDDWSAK